MLKYFLLKNYLFFSVPYVTEITLIRASIDKENIMTQYPGLYIYTGPGRLIRPVKNLLSDSTEFIGNLFFCFF